MHTNLTADENFILAHISMFGSDAYPVRKMGRKWFVTGMRGIGSFPTAFKTKREAIDRWELFFSLLRDKAAGRLAA